MFLPSTAIRRPVTVLVAVLAILLFGYLSVGRLGLDLLPRLDFPMTAVVTVYPNADPETVESTVTVHIERALRSVRNIRSVRSFSMENVSLAVAEFNWGSDLSAAADDVRSNLDRLGFMLPDGVQSPVVTRMDPSQIPVVIIAIGAPGDIADVTREVRSVVSPAIERIQGVAGVLVSGGADRVITVEYDHEALVEAGLTPTLLQQLITYQNVSIPAGTVVDDGVRYQTKVGAKFTSAQDVANLAIGLRRRTESPAQSTGLMGLSLLMPSFMTVGDVAKVEETFQSAEGYSRINGKSAVVIMVYKQSGENSVMVANRIKQAISDIKSKYSYFDISYVFDQSEFITGALADISGNAALGGVLAVLVLLMFLRSLRSTMVIAVSIPLSIIFTLVLMYSAGLTLNLMTIGGLALGVGMLVDNSIVVLESIHRRRELGDSPIEAAVVGAREVGVAITASTFTTVGVFLPVVFLRSFAGQLFKDLAITVSFSLFASLVVALTVVPLLSFRLMRLGRLKLDRSAPDSSSNRRTLSSVYEAALNTALRRPGIVFVLAGLSIAAAIATYPFLGLEFLPAMDTGRVDVFINMPPGTPVEITNEVSLRLESALVAEPWVESVTSQVGSAGSGDYLAVTLGTAANKANITVTLKRAGSSAISSSDATRRIRSMLDRTKEDYPDLKGKVNPSSIGGSSSGAVSDYFGTSVSLEITGREPRVLADLAMDVVDALRGTKGLTDVSSTANDLQPVLLLDVNRTRALMGGLTVAQIGLGVRSGALGTTVTSIERSGESIPVIVKPAAEGALTLDTLMKMPIMSTMALGPMGAMSQGGSSGASLLAPATEVVVNRVATARAVDGPINIERRDGQRYVTVSASYEGMSLSDAGNLALSVARQVSLPPGYEINLSGTHRMMQDSFSDLGLAGLIAVALVYMIMAVQFESLLYPFIILLTLPLAGIGALGMLLVSGTSLGVTAIIGLIVLAGVVVNNGIVMVDYTNQLKSEGLPSADAVLRAGRARLRPILMTALTTILGLVPLAFAGGRGSELEAPLAMTVIGGLVTSTFLTLFVIPVTYLFLDGLSARLSRREVRIDETQ